MSGKKRLMQSIAVAGLTSVLAVTASFSQVPNLQSEEMVKLSDSGRAGVVAAIAGNEEVMNVWTRELSLEQAAVNQVGASGQIFELAALTENTDSETTEESAVKADDKEKTEAQSESAQQSAEEAAEENTEEAAEGTAAEKTEEAAKKAAATKETVEKKAAETKAAAKAPAKKAAATKTAAKAPAKKEAAAKAPAAKKETAKAPAKKTAAKPAAKKAPAKKAAAKKTVETVYVQCFGYEVTTDDIKAKVAAAVGKKTVKELNIYVKPEEGMIYYTADGEQGSVNL